MRRSKFKNVWRSAAQETGYSIKVRKLSDAMDFIGQKGFRDQLLTRALETSPIYRSDSQILVIEHFIRCLDSFSVMRPEYHRDVAAEAELRIFEEGEVVNYQGDPITEESVACVVAFDKRTDKNLTFVSWHAAQKGNELTTLGECISTFTSGSLCGYDELHAEQPRKYSVEKTQALVIRKHVLDRVHRMHKKLMKRPTIESRSDKEIENIAVYFSTFPPLAQLSEACRVSIAKSCKIVDKNHHEPLFRYNDLPRHVYWVLRGSVGLFIQYESSRINSVGIHPAYGLHIAQLSAGQVFGEYGLEKEPIMEKFSLISTDATTRCLVLDRNDYVRLKTLHKLVSAPLDRLLLPKSPSEPRSQCDIGLLKAALSDPPLCYFFNQLPHRIVTRVCERMEMVRSRKGEAIYNVGEKPEAMFLILTGSVQLTIQSESKMFNHRIQGKTRQVELGSGDAFGQVELADGVWRKATAAGEAQLIKISAAEFNRWIKPIWESVVFEAASTLHGLEEKTQREESPKHVERLLHNLGFFPQIPPFLLRQVAAHLQLQRPKVGTLVVEQGGGGGENTSATELVVVLSGIVSLHSKHACEDAIHAVGTGNPLCNLSLYPDPSMAKEAFNTAARQKRYGPIVRVLVPQDVIRVPMDGDSSSPPVSVVAMSKDCAILRLAEKHYLSIVRNRTTMPPLYTVPTPLRFAVRDAIALLDKTRGASATPENATAYMMEWLRHLELPGLFTTTRNCAELSRGLRCISFSAESVIVEYDRPLSGLLFLVEGQVSLYKKPNEVPMRALSGKAEHKIPSLVLARTVASNYSKTSKHFLNLQKRGDRDTTKSQASDDSISTLTAEDGTRTSDEVADVETTRVTRLHPGDVYGERLFQDRILESENRLVADTNGSGLWLSYDFLRRLKQRLLKPSKADDVESQLRSAASRLKWKSATRRVGETIRRERPNTFMGVIQNASAQRTAFLLRMLADVPAFCRMSPQLQEKLCSKARYETAKSDQMIFSIHDPPQRMYILLEGAVRYFPTPSPTEHPIGHVNAGEIFGEFELLQGLLSRNVYARAIDTCKLVSFPAEAFLKTWDTTGLVEQIDVLRQLPGLACIESERLSYLYCSMIVQDYVTNDQILRPNVLYDAVVVVAHGACTLSATVELKSRSRGESSPKGPSLQINFHLAVVSSRKQFWLDTAASFSLVAASANVRILFIPLQILKRTLSKPVIATMEEEVKLAQRLYVSRTRQLRKAALAIMKNHVQMKRQASGTNPVPLHTRSTTVPISAIATTTNSTTDTNDEGRIQDGRQEKQVPAVVRSLPTPSSALIGSFGGVPETQQTSASAAADAVVPTDDKSDQERKAVKPKSAKIPMRSSIRQHVESSPMRAIRLAVNETQYKGLGKLRSAREPIRVHRPLRLARSEYRPRRMLQKPKLENKLPPESNNTTCQEVTIELNVPTRPTKNDRRVEKAGELVLRKSDFNKRGVTTFVVVWNSAIRVFKSKKDFEDGRPIIGSMALDASVQLLTSPEGAQSPFDFVLASGDQQLWLSSKSYVDKSKWIGMLLQCLVQYHSFTTRAISAAAVEEAGDTREDVSSFENQLLEPIPIHYIA